MTNEEFKNLQAGDVIRNKSTETTYIVTDHFGDRVTAVRIADVTNPSECDIESRVIQRATPIKLPG